MRKAVTVLLGSAAMALFVAVLLAILTSFAGAWGVPWFTFATARGSTCTNTLTGYTCSPTTLADVEYFGRLDLPADTTVVTGTYRSTHDYFLTSTLTVPAASSAAALTSLHATFGRCRKGHPSALDGQALRETCVMANDTVVTLSGEPDSRLYVVATGVRRDGTRVVDLALRSR